MTKTGCPFCNPLSRVIKSNSTAQMFLSDPRKVPGHFIVTSKKHVEKPWELKAKEINDIFELIFFIEKKVIGKLGEGCDIRQNYRPFVKQNALKIDHIYFHVIPRSYQDYIYQKVEKYETDLFAELDDLESQEVIKLLD